MAPLNRSHKGRRNEHRSKALFLEMPFYMVVRAAGSKGQWDLVAINLNTGMVTLVQVKSNRTPPILSIDEANKYPSSVNLVYHVWKDYSRDKYPLIINARTGERVGL